MRRHEHKHSKTIRHAKTWLLICRRFRQDTDFHAAYGADVLLYGDTVEELAQRIDRYYMTGKITSTFEEEESALFNDRDDDTDNDWLEQIKQLRNLDKARSPLEQEQQGQVEAHSVPPLDLLRSTQAYKLLCQMQKVLLNGAGVLSLFSTLYHN